MVGRIGGEKRRAKGLSWCSKFQQTTKSMRDVKRDLHWAGSRRFVYGINVADYAPRSSTKMWTCVGASVLRHAVQSRDCECWNVSSGAAAKEVVGDEVGDDRCGWGLGRGEERGKAEEVSSKGCVCKVVAIQSRLYPIL